MSTLLLVSQTVAAKTQTMVVNTKSSPLALRLNGAGSPVKCWVPKGTKVIVESSGMNQWAKVSVPGQPKCGSGWMASWFLKKTQAKTQTMVVNTKSSPLALRLNGAGSPVKCWVPKGTPVTVESSGMNQWVKVSVPGQPKCGSGWMASWYLKNPKNVSGSMVMNNKVKPKSSSSRSQPTSISAARSDSQSGSTVSLSTPICECKGCVMTSGYGPRYLQKFKRYDFHHGHDYAGPVGTPVSAMADAEVVTVENGCTQASGLRCNRGLGNYVTLKIEKPIKGLNGGTYDPPIYMHFSHLDTIDSTVQEGMRVKRGASLGTLGSTGYSTGPHLDIKITKVSYYSKSEYTGADYLGQPLAYKPSLFFGSRSKINSTLKESCPGGHHSAPPQRGNNQERSAQ